MTLLARMNPSTADLPIYLGKKGWIVWMVFAGILVVLPWIFSSSLALNMLSQMGYFIIICLSYNILLGQGGMLSFGYAVYTGWGSFIAVRAMNLAAQGVVPIPLVLIPAVGGLAGLLLAMILGFVNTRRAGTAFAMISLGIGELVVSMALMLPSWFGGEGGISADRMYGTRFLGISFGSGRAVYYLVAVYCFVSVSAMFAFTRTPLGRILNAVRDNPERAQFIGYDARQVRYLAFLIAGFFAGIGGGLAAIHFETVNVADSVGMLRSGSYLLFTFLGGTAFFVGPIIGAVLLVLALVWFSALSNAWLLYTGLVFIFMVMYAPGGVASLVMANIALARQRKWSTVGGAYFAMAVTGCTGVLGLACMVEMAYHLQMNAVLGPQVLFGGMALNAESPATWCGAALVMLTGAGLFEVCRRQYARAGEAHKKTFGKRWGEM